MSQLIYAVDISAVNSSLASGVVKKKTKVGGTLICSTLHSLYNPE